MSRTVVALALALVLASCGGDDDDADVTGFDTGDCPNAGEELPDDFGGCVVGDELIVAVTLTWDDEQTGGNGACSVVRWEIEGQTFWAQPGGLVQDTPFDTFSEDNPCLADVASSAAETSTTPPVEMTTPPAPVEPQPTLASPYLQGTFDMQLPAGDAGEVSVIAVGPVKSSTPVVVRNNTSMSVEVHLSATARDATGELAGSGEDQGLEPVAVEPGQLAIGYVYLGVDDPRAGTTIDVTARGEQVDDVFGGIPAAIIEHNLVQGEFSEQLVGIARNDSDVPMEGPISVLVMCFNDAGDPVTTSSGFTNVDALEPGDEGSFSVDLFGESGCPQYLFGASGHRS